MITEDYCSYEVNKLLLEMGFPFMCDVASLWIDKQGNTKLHTSFAPITWVNEDDPDTPCVTQELAMKWMREEYKLSIEISSTESDKWIACVYEIGVTRNFVEAYISTYDTYKEAIDATLKYCLTNLI